MEDKDQAAGGTATDADEAPAAQADGGNTTGPGNDESDPKDGGEGDEGGVGA